MVRKILIGAGVLAVGSVLFAAGMHASERGSTDRFDNPRFKGIFVDACLDRNCSVSGRGSADFFCRNQGIPRASYYQISGPQPERTIRIGDGTICPNNCKRFLFIVCSN